MATSTINKLNYRLANAYFPMREIVTDCIARHGLLCEKNAAMRFSQFDEHFLQALWNEQFFTGRLMTVGGASLKIISPGTWNLEAGPDFKNAVIKIADKILHGDVEIHKRNCDWQYHGHDGDSNYENVILHAVWSYNAASNQHRTSPPFCFEMQSFIDRPWYAASEAIELETGYPYARQVGPGACVSRFARIEDRQLRGILKVAGLSRFREKSGRFQRIAIARGSDQSLYELIFEALGYKANKEGFRNLARQMPLAMLEEMPDFIKRRAALFGAAGFLPDTTQVRIPEKNRQMARQMWDAWWRLGCQPVRSTWRRGSCRPMNSPERRLAAGVEMLERWHWKPAVRLKSIVHSANGSKDLIRRFRRELSFTSDWDGFATFQRSLKRPARLLGENRQRDIIANIFLPAAWSMLVRDGRDAKLAMIESAFLKMPRLQDNRALTEAVHRMLAPPSRMKEVVRLACEQQGMMALYKDFCMRLDMDCANCPVMNSALFEKLLPMG